jgi:hypothetical protein
MSLIHAGVTLRPFAGALANRSLMPMLHCPAQSPLIFSSRFPDGADRKLKPQFELLIYVMPSFRSK